MSAANKQLLGSLNHYLTATKILEQISYRKKSNMKQLSQWAKVRSAKIPIFRFQNAVSDLDTIFFSTCSENLRKKTISKFIKIFIQRSRGGTSLV